MIIMLVQLIIVLEGYVHILHYLIANLAPMSVNVLIQITPQVRAAQMVNVFILKRLHVEPVIITVPLDALILMIMIVQLYVTME
jgi:hypothetical protein